MLCLFPDLRTHYVHGKVLCLSLNTCGRKPEQKGQSCKIICMWGLMKSLRAYIVVSVEMTYPPWGLLDSTLPLCKIFTTKGKLKLKRRGKFLPELPHSLNLLTRVLHLWTLDVMMRGFGKYPSSPNLNQWHHFLLSCLMMTERFMKISSSHTPVCNRKGLLELWRFQT